MGLFLKYGLAAMVFAGVLVFIYDHTIGPFVHRTATTTVRAGVFVSAWTAVTTFLGSRDFKKSVSALRQKTKDIR